MIDANALAQQKSMKVLPQHVQGPDVSNQESEMASLLTGRFHDELLSSPTSSIRTPDPEESSPGMSEQGKEKRSQTPEKKEEESIEELPAASGERTEVQEGNMVTADEKKARFLARLGIRTTPKRNLSPDAIDELLVSLCHSNEQKRIDTAYAIADLYAQLPTTQQLQARMNLILMAWRDISSYARVAAIEALAQLNNPDVSEALQLALYDEVADVRAAAARAVGRVHAKALADAVQGKSSLMIPVAALVAAARDSKWNVRASAIQSMGMLKDRAFINAIANALDDKDASVRSEALYAFAQIEGERAISRLTMIIKNDPAAHVRLDAAHALEALSDQLVQEEKELSEKQQREDDS